MSYPFQNELLSKLKQSIAERQYGKRFHELLNTNIKLNRDQKNNQIELLSSNAVLPSLSNGKIGLVSRNKSQSAKKIIYKPQVEKNSNQRSTKIIKASFQKQSNKKQEYEKMELLLIKKQNIVDSSLKQISTIRSKVYSMKTPEDDRFHKEPLTKTKDVSIFRSASHAKLEKDRQSSIKEFTSQIQQHNQDFLLQIKSSQITPQQTINKKFFSIVSNLKQKNPEHHAKILKLMQQINKFIMRYKIDRGFIEVKRLINLANNKKHSNYQLIHLFSNKNQILGKTKILGMDFYTIPDKKGKNLAASKIISLFKMVYSKRFYHKFRALVQKVKIIQGYWRTCLLIRRTRKAMLESISLKLKKCTSLQKQLSKNWQIIKTSIRYEIHISAYCLEQFKRLTIKGLQQRQNNQITRIFKALETDVHVIYVTPFQCHEDLIKYYNSIFNFNAQSNIQEKVYFITPENAERLGEYNLTTVTKLLYSPKALKRIRQIIGKQYAYIVPSFPSVQYVNLSAELNTPVLSFNQNLAKLHSTKSGCMKILKPLSLKEKAPFLLPKSLQSIFSQKQLINSLAILINKNKHIKTWYLKIQDQIQGRGIAYLNITKITFLRQLCSKEQLFDNYDQNEIIKLIVQELKGKLKIRLKILNKDVYANYQQFINHFLTRGGVIQAGIEGDKLCQFSISFFIDPTGQFNIIGTYNKLELNGKSINQSIKVPSMLHQIDYELITRNLYKELWQKNKFFGYFTADFIHTEQTIIPYAIGLDCFLNQKTSSLFMINFCTGGRYNKDQNCLLKKEEEELHYIFCPIIKLNKTPVVSTFFKNCKYENIAFDLEKKIGTIFVLIDKIENEQVGFLCVDKDADSLLREVKKIVDYFSRTYRQGKNSHDQIGLLKGVITTWLKKYDKQKQAIKDCL